MLFPAGFQSALLIRICQARLIEEHDDRFVEPGEEVQFGLKVSSHDRVFRGIDQVEDDIRLVVDVSNGLLAAPKRLVSHSIPDL